MRILAVIPARGGSKRLPGKNILPCAGKPLVAHTLEQVQQARLIDRTIVSTENSAIAAVAQRYGVEVIWRPAELASDTATTLAVLRHALNEVERQGWSPDLVILLQCTSPVRRPEDIDHAIQTLLAQDADSLFSACVSHACIWQEDAGGLRAVTYEPANRQREQDWPRQLRENGSIFVMKPWVLREMTGNFLGGKIAVYEMDVWSSFQIDAPEDLELCEWILQRASHRLGVSATLR